MNLRFFMRPVTLAFLLIATTITFAQQTPEEQLDQITQDATAGFVPLADLPPLDVDKAPANTHILTFGMTANNAYYADSTLNNNIFLGFYRPYMTYYLNEKHGFDVRGRLQIRAYEKKPSSGKQTELVGALEVMRFILKFDGHNLEVGRRFYRLGRGIVFNNYGDGFAYRFNHKYIGIKAVGMFSGEYGSLCQLSIQGCTTSNNPYEVDPNRTFDATVTNPGQRVFYGGMVKSPSFLGAQLYAMGLFTNDLIDESGLSSSTQKTKFNPYYAGGGVRGFIWNANYRYSFEGIYSGGTTQDLISNNTNNQSSISSTAFLAEFKWTIPWLQNLIKPGLNLQAAYGSGEEDLDSSGNAGTANHTILPSKSNSVGNYNTFYTFGTFSGGLALKPQLSNIMVGRAGISLKPLYKFYAFRGLGLVTTYSIYQKAKAKGFISDTTAVEVTESNGSFTSTNKPIDSKDIGWAIDTVLIFNFTSDVKVFYAFGLFKPGKAYPAKDTSGKDGRRFRTTHFISLNLTF